jgi:hypothetical protein
MINFCLKNIFQLLLYLATFLIGYYLYVMPILGKDLEYIPGSLGDTRLNIYFLEHAFGWAIGSISKFWDAPFYFPVKNVMSYSDTHLGSFVFYSIFRIIGIERETSYQLWIVVGILLNYLSMIWLLEKWNLKVLSVCSGALIYAFSAVAILHLSMHSQLLYRFPIPFALFYFVMYLNSGNIKNLYKFSAFLSLQFYCSIYLGYFAALFFIAYSVVFISIFYFKRFRSNLCSKDKDKYKIKYIFFAFFGFSLAMLPLFYPYVTTALVDKIGNNSEIIYSMLPRFESYLLNASPNKIIGIAYVNSTLPVKHEHVMYLGLLPFISVLYFIFFHRRFRNNSNVNLYLIVSTFILIALTINVEGLSLYHFMLFIPGVDSIRAVSRVGIIFLLPASIISAYFIDNITRQQGSLSLRLLIIIPLLLLYGLENRLEPYHYSKKESIERLDLIKNVLPKNLPKETVLAYLNPNIGNNDYYLTELDSMLLAQSLGLQTLNGYSGRSPKGHSWLESSSDVLPLIADYKKMARTYDISSNSKILLIYNNDGDIKTRWSDLKKYPPYRPQSLPYESEIVNYSSKIKFTEIPERIGKSKLIYITLSVTNTGTSNWNFSGMTPVLLSYRWREFSKILNGADGFHSRLSFDRDILPNNTYIFTFPVISPASSGNYYLEVELVKEHISFFRGYHADATVFRLIKVE